MHRSPPSSVRRSPPSSVCDQCITFLVELSRVVGRDEGESLLDGSLKGRDGEPYGLPIRGGGREIISEAYGFLKEVV